MVQPLMSVQGDADELGPLDLHLLKAVFELFEIMGVVQSRGNAEHTFDNTADEMFVQYPDLEVNWGLVVTGAW